MHTHTRTSTFALVLGIGMLVIPNLPAQPTSTAKLAITVAEIDRARILKLADQALKLKPPAVTDHIATNSAGGPHDFYSQKDYYWPNPTNQTGLPYVSRDGETNPANFEHHRMAMRDMKDAVAALAAAYAITGDDKYAAKAAELIKVFFLDENTKMNPSLNYAQAALGSSSGTASGIIDTLHLAELPVAVSFLEKSRAFDPEVDRGLKQWFADYITWMTTNTNGVSEMNNRNNHSIAYFVQLASFAKFTGDRKLLELSRIRFKDVLLPKQMATNGSFTLELRRTKPYGYSIFQADNVATLCVLLSTPEDDLWKFRLLDGGTARKAMDYIYPYLADKNKWLADGRPKDVMHWDNWPMRQPCLLFAYAEFGDEKYFNLWKKLNPDPTDLEIRRNVAITQPLLWIASPAQIPLLKPAGTKSARSKSRPKNTDAESVQAEHSDIGLTSGGAGSFVHTLHPDAQWYPETGLGLFIHWGIASVKAMNISWPMIPGRALANRRITDPAERERIIREGDYNLNGKPNSITPNEYWEMAKDFNPQKYDPDKWLKAAKAAGFVYAVLTTRHHEGFALWPSAYGNFDTKNYMGGRDLLKDYVEACRRNGLKVGFYYSPPDWYFEKDFKDFMYGGGHKNNPEFPPLGPDLKPRTTKLSDEELAKRQVKYAALVKGQVEELLTRYGKIDLLWFDGRPPIPNGNNCITVERIRELQPGIVINPRLHGHGDFETFERTLRATKPVDHWAEFCNTWTTGWSHQNIPFRAPGFVLGQYVTSRSLGVNYLLGVGPMATGEFCDGIYQNMAVVADWMKRNGASVRGTKPLPASESASVPATASGSVRYLFALPRFANGGAFDKDLSPPTDLTLTLKGVAKPSAVKLLGDGTELKSNYSDGAITIELPAVRRSKLVDVVRIDLASAK